MAARRRTTRTTPRDAPASSLRIHALGPLRVRRNDAIVPSSAWLRQKSRALFAHLLCAHPRGVHRDVLVDLMWPDADPGRGAHALQVAVSDLRATLGGSAGPSVGRQHVRRAGELYALDLGPGGQIDADAFEAACDGVRRMEEADDPPAMRQQLRLAEALYTGDFLADEPYVEWAAARRERLRDDYLDVLIRLARLHEGLHELEPAARTLRRALTVDPYREGCYRNLMRLRAALGDPSGVLRTYARCRDAMRDGFDTDVAPETRALARGLIGPRVDELIGRDRPARRHA